MKALTLLVDVVADDLPPVGQRSLDAARRRWVERRKGETSLLDHRVACWRYLDHKNGNSMTIADRQDHALRALICVLHDEPDDDLYDTVEFTLDLLAAVGVRGSTVAAIIDGA